MSSIRILQNYSKVLLIVNGKCVAAIPAGKAKEVGKAMQLVGARAEEWERASQVITDQAIMMRTGAPFSLTGDPKLNAEAFKEAQWNTDLRRYIPNAKGVKSEEAFGRASIKVRKKK